MPKYKILLTNKHKINETQKVKHKGQDNNFQIKIIMKLFP